MRSPPGDQPDACAFKLPAGLGDPAGTGCIQSSSSPVPASSFKTRNSVPPGERSSSWSFSTGAVGDRNVGSPPSTDIWANRTPPGVDAVKYRWTPSLNTGPTGFTSLEIGA